MGLVALLKLLASVPRSLFPHGMEHERVPPVNTADLMAQRTTARRVVVSILLIALDPVYIPASIRDPLFAVMPGDLAFYRVQTEQRVRAVFVVMELSEVRVFAVQFDANSAGRVEQVLWSCEGKALAGGSLFIAVPAFTRVKFAHTAAPASLILLRRSAANPSRPVTSDSKSAI